MAEWIGLNPPFLRRNRFMDTQIDDRLIKNDLVQLLLTSPGERVFRPTFGTPIRKFVFENTTPEAMLELKAEITIAIERFETRVTVKTLDIVDNTDRNEIVIKLTVTINGSKDRSLLVELAVPFGGVSEEVREING